MRGIDAAVDELDDLALALLGKAVGPHHLGRGTGGSIRLVAPCDGAVASGDLVIRGERMAAIEEGSLDAGRRLDDTERRGGRLDRKAIKGVAVVAHVGDGRTRESRGYGLADALLHLRVVRGVVGPGLARLELDDDRRRGVVRALLGRRGLGGVGLVRKGCGHADCGEREGTGRYERQCCASVVKHCLLAFFTHNVLSCMWVSDRAAHPCGTRYGGRSVWPRLASLCERARSLGTSPGGAGATHG